ncbi:transglutaminase [Nostoc punctiforme NIES-2108]|uniref:Transglutaminase n=1 Tax=Nostoc punctiforme NIES-2108 TaxID=1356359 RepID=A0A367R5A0_NOSPU|nr:transglutaminase [Nostoc punctiforme NIES-2108]
MTLQQQILDFYSRPTGMTSAGEFASMLNTLPNDVAALVRIVQGLGVYDVVAPDFYDFNIPDERKNEIHIRSIEKMLDRLFAIDDQLLTVARPVEKRLVCRCRNFSLLLLSMLRAKGIPARLRCGFAAYFKRGYFEDHWVCEYWNAAKKRWILVDAQLDEVWQENLMIDFDILDVPRSSFLVAGDAWAECRTGEADPSKFGIAFADLYGLWFVAGNLVRDVAALNKMEMLPWDIWGVQLQPDEPINDEHLEFFDKLTAFSCNPDVSFDELHKFYEENDDLRVPTTVFNSLLNRVEMV